MKQKLILAILFITITQFGFSQQRVGVDVNSHLINLNFSAHYQKVIRGPLLFSCGVFAGGFGHGQNENSNALVEAGHDVKSAYPGLANFRTDSSGLYNLKGYYVIGKGYGIHLGLGLFHEFNTTHGIRFNVNNRIGWMKSRVTAYYHKTGESRPRVSHSIFHHPIGSLNLELSHTLRVSGRSTFYWGIKAPYYYTLDKGRYAPQRDSELFNKFKLDLSVGLTRVIGTCD